MNKFRVINLVLFAVLCLIWGSSYILIKLGLYGNDGGATLSAFQVAAIRICSAGLSLLPIFILKFQRYTLKTWAYLIASGLLVMFIPAFLFCVAETKLDSGLAAILNVLTPVFVILLNYLLYSFKVSTKQIMGVILSTLGVIMLLGLHKNINLSSLPYAVCALLATVSYAINAVVVKNKLSAVPPLTITTLSFVPLIIPALPILIATGYFHSPLTNTGYGRSTAAACLLGVLCSTVAWTVFYQLMKRSSARFASSVSFIVPIVALGWGWLYGESVSLIQGGCMILILLGIYMTNPELKINLKYAARQKKILNETFLD